MLWKERSQNCFFVVTVFVLVLTEGCSFAIIGELWGFPEEV